MPSPIARRLLAVAVAILACFLAVAPTLGASWYPKVALTTHSDAGEGGLVTLSDTNAVAVYTDTARVYTRRTTDSGATWKPRVQIAGKSSDFVAISGRDSDVDVVWTIELGAGNYALRYAHSANGGISFGASLNIATNFGVGHVARGPNGLVVVAWHDTDASLIKVRVSTNDGASFGSEKTIASITSTYIQPPVVAIASGVIYVAYFVDPTTIELRRSLNNGVRWTRAQAIADDGYLDTNINAVSITAERSSAFIAYSAKSGADRWVRYTHTVDKGVSWEPLADLSPASDFPSDTPVIDLKDGIARAVYSICVRAGCSTGAFVGAYRESSDGTSWSAAEVASHSSALWAVPEGVGWAGRTLVLYAADHYASPYVSDADMYVRSK